jgi:hypothetical protein
VVAAVQQGTVRLDRPGQEYLAGDEGERRIRDNLDLVTLRVDATVLLASQFQVGWEARRREEPFSASASELTEGKAPLQRKKTHPVPLPRSQRL